MADNFIYPGKPKTKEELDAEVKRKEAQKARQNMVDYAKDKDIHDKIDFADDLLTAIGAVAASIKGAKGNTSPKTQNDVARKAEKAKTSSGVTSYKMAAGAEGYDPNAVRESINTDDLTFQEGVNMKNALNDAKIKLGGSSFELDPSAEIGSLDEFKDKPKIKSTPISKLNPTQRLLNAVKKGFETIGDQRNASARNYMKNRMREQTQIVNPDSYQKDTSVLTNSIRDKKGNVTETNWDEIKNPPPEPKASSKSLNKLAQQEAKAVDNVISFMDEIRIDDPKIVEEIRRFKDDLELGKINGNRLSKDAWIVVMNEMEGRKAPRNFAVLEARKEPIKQGILSSMTDEEIITNGRKVLGNEDVDNIIKQHGAIKGKEKIAEGIAALTSSMLYSNEKNNKDDNKKLDNLVDKVVKGNKAQFADKGAKVWLKDKAKAWNQWINSFDAESMENEEDYKAFLEATQLIDDYNNNRNIVANSGNTNPMAELLTNPKYVRLLLKYEPK